MLGSHFDVVINLDGFNEVALPPAELSPSGIFELYPRNWPYKVAALDAELRRALGGIAYTGELRRKRAAMFSGAAMSKSPTLGLIWAFLDSRLARRIDEWNTFLTNRDLGVEGYQTRGPNLERLSGSDPLGLIVDVWIRASVQMFRLCAANEIEYYHFLQPNQYVPGSKVLTSEEQRNAWRADHPYRDGAVAGYPRMISRSRELIDEGVSFHDLSRIFTNVQETLYVDDCCHVNSDGTEMLARHIGRIVAGTGDSPGHAR